MTLIDAVAARTGIPYEQIVGKQRQAPVVHARHLAMWLIRNNLDWSYPQLGRFFDRDHSTVIHGVSMIEGLYRHNTELRRWLDSQTMKAHV